MKYLRAKFKNYIGFYNGMGLTELDIDFTRCHHNIILIIAKNGAGKSSLVNSLNVFPDPSSSFIKGKDAEKYLVLFDAGNTYEIHIISQADDKGGRKNTKAFINKNGIELNENGNVSSYKEIIFTEFELDSNYISLSNLSSNDRGLGDKTPAERKKFVANIIDNLDIYNNMYKNLNKKSLIYKSHVNTLHTKIQNIGRKEDIEVQINNLINKEAIFRNKITELNNMIVAIQAKNSIDEDELKTIENANIKIKEWQTIIDGINTQIDQYEHQTHIKPIDIISKCSNDKALLDKYNLDLENVKSKWKDKYSRLNSISDSLNTIKAESIGLDSNSDIGDKYKKSNELIKELKSSIGSYSEDDIFELTNLANLYMKLVLMIDDFYDNLDDATINMIVTNYTSLYKDTLSKESNKILKDIDCLKIEIVKIQEQMRILAVLENRPSKCKIDSCAFISDAINLKKSIKDNPEDKLSELQGELLNLSENYSKIEEKITIYDSLFPKYMKLVSIRNTISENSQLIMKYNADFLNTVDKKLSESNPFNDIRDYQSITNIINSLKLYKTELDNNKLLEVEYKSYQEKVRIINANRIMSEKLEKEKQEVESDIAILKSEINNYESLIESLTKSVSIESEYSNIYSKLAEPVAELNKYNSIIENANIKSAKAIESLKEIDLYKNQIDDITKELNPIVEQINLLQGQLTLLNSYYDEYNEYKRSYDIIETIKKYCSPTGGGIQTLFMQLYMSKTLELSNNVLSMLFGGEYRLLDFIINENEFRIPFIGSGLPVDDISSGSSSQICIMGMVINLVLLHQASTKFNIARLDEIDAGLDNRNRTDFINFIFHTMNILNIEQVFMISHSIEADNSNADIIKLKMYDNYESGIQSGNIIFDYNEFIQS